MPMVKSAEDEYLATQEDDPLDCLTEKQRFVMELRYGLVDGVVYTQKQVGLLMGISQKAVSNHEKAAKKKLDRVLKPGT